jgi:hypothetical protein
VVWLNRKILIYELVGIFVIIMFGSFFHFAYELSGYNLAVGAFSAVNESVWEHLKLALFPSLIFALVEFLPLRREANNFWLAKAVSVYFMITFIPIIFYTYTAFTGESIFAVDFSSFVVTVILGQIISLKLLSKRKFSAWLKWLGIALLVVLVVVFVAFTFLPPHLGIFQDSVTGGYGIP